MSNEINNDKVGSLPHRRSEKQLETDLTASLLNDALLENEKLKVIIEQLQQSRIALRDLVAASVFPSYLSIDFKSEIAAEDSYKTADAFMRVRERGRSYEDDLLEIFEKMVKKNPNDTELGEEVRRWMTSKVKIN